ncbi:MAG: hypothetical protein HRU06_19905 [Oceanospirillaceae bacterium]|nr:hypothetical protein [Oceanospirillaceae bacterium]
MQLDIYLIRGRGLKGDEFQLAIVKNKQGYYYPGEYDLATQYKNMDELREMLADMVNVDKEVLELSELNL